MTKILLEARGLNSGDFLVGVHPGARSVNRQWGEGELHGSRTNVYSTQFPVKIIWFQEPGQHAAAPTGNQIVPLSLPLREFMAVLSQCAVFICNDSGPMHIATALNVPVVAVFGPTEPAWFGPLGPKIKIVIRSGFWCRPCFDYCIVRPALLLADNIGARCLSDSAEMFTDLLARRSSSSLEVGMMKECAIYSKCHSFLRFDE